MQLPVHNKLRILWIPACFIDRIALIPFETTVLPQKV
jgi:hypothetical protein